MPGKAAKTPLTVRMYENLLQLSSSRNAGNAVVARANVILVAFQ